MTKPKKSKIDYFQLAKIEKRYNGQTSKYFYNIGFDNIDDLLILELDYPIKDSLVGLEVKYTLNENVIVDFELI